MEILKQIVGICLGVAGIVFLFSLSYTLILICKDRKKILQSRRCGSCGSMITDYAYVCQEVTCLDCLAEEGLGLDSPEWEKR